MAAKQPSWRSDKRKTSERGYGWRWQQARESFLRQPENALCRMCKKHGRVTAATTVDHIVAHEGSTELFWDRSNWQPLCAPCHSGEKQALEKSGRVAVRIGLDGWPVETD
jgi:5-methylcytosine-specific restriction enzyme A